jgi:site-specific recombinase XerD
MIDPIVVSRLNASPFYEVQGLSPALSRDTKDFFELYLAKGFSRRTIRAYAFDLVVFFRFFTGKKSKIPPLSSVNFEVLIKFIHQEKSRNAAPASINRRLNTVDILYRHCFNKLIPGTDSRVNDPTRFRHKRYLTLDAKLGIFPIHAKPGRTFRVRMPHRLVKALEPNEVNAFFETLKSNRDRAIVTLMLVCGLRCAEVLALDIVDVDSLSGQLKVCGKGNKERMVPLPEQVWRIIEKYIETERPVRSKDEAVFLVQKGPRRGMRMSLEGLRSVFRYKRAASGIQHANAHRFRHTFGRNMAAAGVSLPTLQKLLGHADHRTTIKYINLTLQDVFQDFEKAHANIKNLYGKSV